MSNNGFMQNTGKSLKERTATVRLRTWTLTLGVIVALCFYLLVNIVFTNALNPVDFVLIVVLQLLVYSLYFPDGELYGQEDRAFQSNKKTYNIKATRVNQKHLIGKLREYCKFEYNQRKKEYIENECGYIGITPEEVDLLRDKTPKEIMKLETWEVPYFNEKGESDGSKLLVFNKSKRRRLKKLLFDRLPVEENHAETILSAVENTGNKAIKDHSLSYKRTRYIFKLMKVMVVGVVLGYTGYILRDGVGLTEIAQIVTYLCTIFATAVMAYTSGEKCQRIHKSNFYVELYNFLDGFFEWANIPEEVVSEQTTNS